MAVSRFLRFRNLSSIVLFILVSICITAELWSASKPIVLNHAGEIYFPFIYDYHPKTFGIYDTMKVNYDELEQINWAVWPLNSWSPNDINMNLKSYPSPPSETNLFGTDDKGRDVLARLIYGGRISFIFASIVWLFSSMLGVSYGLISGFLGERSDLWMQRFIEIYSSIPFLFILLFLASLFEPNIWILALLSSVLNWMGISIYTRAETLKVRQMEFVEAAKASGVPTGRILFRHIFPHTLTPLITFTPFILVQNIMILAMLDFLGFGLPAPTASWGELLLQGKNYFQVAWWLGLIPAFAIFIVLYTVTQVGEQIRLKALCRMG